jgi:hypothetical protein
MAGSAKGTQRELALATRPGPRGRESDAARVQRLRDERGRLEKECTRLVYEVVNGYRRLVVGDQRAAVTWQELDANDRVMWEMEVGDVLRGARVPQAWETKRPWHALSPSVRGEREWFVRVVRVIGGALGITMRDPAQSLTDVSPSECTCDHEAMLADEAWQACALCQQYAFVYPDSGFTDVELNHDRAKLGPHASPPAVYLRDPVLDS